MGNVRVFASNIRTDKYNSAIFCSLRQTDVKF